MSDDGDGRRGDADESEDPHDHRPDEPHDHDRKQGAVAGALDLEDSDLADEDGFAVEPDDDADEDDEGFSVPTSTEEAYGRLREVRRTHQRRWWFTLHGSLVGLLLATFHPLGVLAGGAIVSLPQKTVGRGLLAGVAFGVVVWAVFVGWLTTVDALAVFRQMSDIAAVTAVIPVVLGLLGSLVRGLV